MPGFPDVPADFQPYLLASPIEAGIIGVEEPTTRPSSDKFQFKDTRVILNAGQQHGLLPGMKLYVIQPDNLVESVIVKKVDHKTSDAVMTQIGEDADGPQSGWRLSTRPRWNRDLPTPTESAGSAQLPEAARQHTRWGVLTAAMAVMGLLMLTNILAIRILFRRSRSAAHC